jgi:phage gpG-like protein
MAYKENGIDMFARSFSHVMKENCRRQLMKEGLPDWKLLPLFCSDGNLRSHKEKGDQGWTTHYDNQSINKMINISTEQVYESHQQPLPITGRNRNKVFKQIKQDNHAQKLLLNSEEIHLLEEK